jgi:hypothetical protein
VRFTKRGFAGRTAPSLDTAAYQSTRIFVFNDFVESVLSFKTKPRDTITRGICRVKVRVRDFRPPAEKAIFFLFSCATGHFVSRGKEIFSPKSCS